MRRGADSGESGPRPRQARSRNLALVGFMGAGKSSVGPLLARELGLDFVELDEEVAARAGASIAEIFEREGEGGFRERESEALREALEAGGRVISCGGGIVTREENVRLLRSACRVYLLEVSPATAVRRLRGGSARPLLGGADPRGEVERLMGERAGRYAAAAHEVVAADAGSPQEIAEEIAARWRRYRCGREGENTPSS